jgi:hypothetical protein
VDLIAALFALGCVYMAYVDFNVVKRFRSSAERELTSHLRVGFGIETATYCVAAAIFSIAAATSSSTDLFRGIYVTAFVAATSAVFKADRPRR